MKLDIIVIFNQIHIWEDDKKYTAFWTWWSLFEQLVMLFDLKNELSIFQHYINNKLHDFLDVFVIVYIDDILIYSSTLFKHQKHVQMILEQLQETDLQCDIKKCTFHVMKIMYLDLIVSHDDIKMNSVKIKAIVDWKSSQNVHNVQAFLEFANLSTIHTTLLEDCTISCELDKENHEVFMRCHVWMCIQWFEEMIHNCLNTCLLWLWSWMCSWSWLIQSCSERCALTIWQEWHVMLNCFFSQKLNAAESNYEIYDKKLLTII